MHYGILQISSNINFILNNEISNNYIGLKLVKSNNNIIRKNNISKNEYGINLSESNYNLFSKNNFIDNFNYHSYFIYSHFNLWLNNYWDDWISLLPKPIIGKIKLNIKDTEINLQWYNYEWHPAKEPFDIGGDWQ